MTVWKTQGETKAPSDPNTDDTPLTWSFTI